MADKITLKPCPFCGGEAKAQTMTFWFGTFDRHTVVCPECNIMIGWYDSEEEAAEKWNRRYDERLRVHNIGNVDIPEGVSEEQFYAVMQGVVAALEHAEKGEAWPYGATMD